MSKVEELAKKYCEGSSFEDACMEKPAYIAGYKQAEKDLELTWKNIREICTQSVLVEFDLGRNVTDERHYTEVLNRFNKQKGK